MSQINAKQNGLGRDRGAGMPGEWEPVRRVGGRYPRLSRVIKGNSVQFSSMPTALDALKGAAEPQILLRRRNNMVESIEIVCSCGEHIHIQCEYGGETPPGTAGSPIGGDSS